MSKTEFTEIYKKLPSHSGVHFEGAKHITIKSWQPVIEKLESHTRYCIEGANSPLFFVIKGEWGQGKTEVYEKHLTKILKNRHFLTSISANNIKNVLENPSHRTFLNKSDILGQRILASIFMLIKETEKSKDLIESIPSIEGFNPRTFITRILDNIFPVDQKNKNLFIFIDEIEDLQESPEILTTFLTGLKDIINGKVVDITDKGDYAGRVHFFLACAPDAYAKMEEFKEISDKYGGIKRRFIEINLPQIKKIEGIKYCWKLIEYSWENRIPEKLPIKSPGILYGLYLSSLGNLGNIVANFSKIFTLHSKDSKFEILNYANFINSVKEIKIQLGQVRENAIKYSKFKKIVERLLETSRAEDKRLSSLIFSLFIGEPQPFSISILQQRLEKKDDLEIFRGISELSQLLINTYQFKHPILKVRPIRKDIKRGEFIDMISKCFQVETKEGEDYFEIDQFQLTSDDLINKITFPIFNDNNKINYQIYLPYTEDDIKVVFEGISEINAKSLMNFFNKEFFDEICEDFYLLSDEVLYSIYPTPIPADLQFLNNPHLIFKLYREAWTDFSSLFEANFSDAFIELFDSIKEYKFVPEPKNKFGVKTLFEYEDERGVTFRTKFLIHTTLGDITKQDISNFKKILEKNPEIQLILPICVGSFSNEAKEMIKLAEIDESGSFYITSALQLRPELARKILIAYLAKTRYENQLSRERFYESIRKFLFDEIEFRSLFKDWLFNKIKRGICIIDLEGRQKVTDFPKFLKLFYLDSEDFQTTETITNTFKTPEIFKGFGSQKKSSLSVIHIPDITKQQVMDRWAEDFTKNNFLESRGKPPDIEYRIKSHIIEERILKILQNENSSMEINAIKRYFIEYSSQAKLLENVFIPILEDKGLIKEISNSYLPF